MERRTLLFAPCAYNLAETTRMVEIAKGVTRHPLACERFAIHFVSDGSEFESLIERHGFALTRMQPRLTPEKIERIGKVDRGEKFAPSAIGFALRRVRDRSFIDSGPASVRRKRPSLSVRARSGNRAALAGDDGAPPPGRRRLQPRAASRAMR
jgi:hypothetical protein